MLGVEGRQYELAVLSQVVADRRLPRDEGAPLRRADVGPRDDIADNSRVPAAASDDEEVVMVRPVLADLAEPDAEARGADARRLRQHFLQIGLTERVAAEARDRRLLPKQSFDLDRVIQWQAPSAWHSRGAITGALAEMGEPPRPWRRFRRRFPVRA